VWRKAIQPDQSATQAGVLRGRQEITKRMDERSVPRSRRGMNDVFSAGCQAIRLLIARGQD